MRINTTEFKGIIRTTSSLLSGEGACEELINVRHTTGKLAVVKRHKALFGNVNFLKIIEHRIGGLTNYVVIVKDNETGHYSIAWLEVIISDEEIITPAYTTIYTSSGTLDVKAFNNMLIITDAVKDHLIVYHYLNGEYKLQYDGLPSAPSLSFFKEDYNGGEQSFNISGATAFTNIDTTTGTMMYALSDMFSCDLDAYNIVDEKMFRDTAIAAIRGLRLKNNEYTEGYVLLSTNYTLVNGEETKMTAPVMVSVGAFVKNPFIYYPAIYDVRIALRLQKLSVGLENIDSINNYTDLIKSVNIYASLPLTHYALDNNEVPTHPRVDNNIFGCGCSTHPQDSWLGYSEKSYNSNEIKSVLMYKQHSIPVAETGIGEKYTIKFGNEQSTEKTMKVDSSGWLRTKGKSFIYNNRLHLYDYERKFTPEASIFSNMNYIKGVANTVAGAHVRVSNSDGKAMYINGSVQIYFLLDDFTEDMKVWLADIVSFPDSRAEYLYIYFGFQGKKYAGKLSLSPSSSYNYAYSVNITNEATPTMICKEVVSYDLVDDDVDELVQNAIIVSSPGAPYHFPVEHSYPMPGRIKALSVMASQISEAQQGQYPLFVFTDSGIFALQQGSGIVLYSNVIPVSNDISTGGVVQTKTGIAYIANNTVNLLYGRIGVSIANVLDGPPEQSIRLCSSFNLAVKNIELYNIYDYLSKVDFREYVLSAQLFYNPVEEEIIVSNSNYLYSYVFNLREKLWHKTTDTYRGVSGGKLALRNTTASQQPALPATATIDISSVVIAEESTFNPQNKCVIEGASAVIPAGQQIQLIIDSSRISSYYTHVETPLYMIIEAMLLTVPFAKLNYNSVTHTADLYTSKDAYNNKTLSIKNITANTLITEILDAYTTAVTITRKGIGQTITATIAGTAITITILATDDYVSITERLKNAIVAGVSTVTATSYLNVITLSTKQTGAAQNNTTITVTSSLHVMLRKSSFSGARDAGAVSLEDSPIDVIDLTEEELSGNAIIHVQTRPLMFGEYGYKKIERAILRGEIKPTGKPFGAYLFGSNDLETWKLVTGIQSDSDIVNMRMQRSKLSYRYYIVVAGGSVSLNSNIAILEAEITDMIGNKIR